MSRENESNNKNDRIEFYDLFFSQLYYDYVEKSYLKLYDHTINYYDIVWSVIKYVIKCIKFNILYTYLLEICYYILVKIYLFPSNILGFGHFF